RVVGLLLPLVTRQRPASPGRLPPACLVCRPSPDTMSAARDGARVGSRDGARRVIPRKALKDSMARKRRPTLRFHLLISRLGLASLPIFATSLLGVFAIASVAAAADRATSLEASSSASASESQASRDLDD